MGTRSLTVFVENDGTEIAVLYRQFDGYPDGHGKELFGFLKGKILVNGLSGDQSKVFNGMGCLAGSVIAHFKTDPGHFYLYPAGTRNAGEEYIYTISDRKGKIHVKVESGYGTEWRTIYDGGVDRFNLKRVNKKDSAG